MAEKNINNVDDAISFLQDTISKGKLKTQKDVREIIDTVNNVMERIQTSFMSEEEVDKALSNLDTADIEYITNKIASLWNIKKIVWNEKDSLNPKVKAKIHKQYIKESIKYHNGKVINNKILGFVGLLSMTFQNELVKTVDQNIIDNLDGNKIIKNIEKQLPLTYKNIGKQIIKFKKDIKNIEINTFKERPKIKYGNKNPLALNGKTKKEK